MAPKKLFNRNINYNITLNMKIISISLIVTLVTTSVFSDEKKSVQKIELSAVGNPPGTMKFAKAEISAKVGTIELDFKNPDVLQHNILILKPNTKDKVGALADAMLTDPEAMKKHYVPDSEDIISASKLINPGGSEKIVFKIDKPGTYPIICTFPGHWRLMNSILKVTESN